MDSDMAELVQQIILPQEGNPGVPDGKQRTTVELYLSK